MERLPAATNPPASDVRPLTSDFSLQTKPLNKEKNMAQANDPNILAFCCKYCSYAAADLAGSMRLDYPASVKVVQVPCTGRVDVIHLLKGLEAGADGIYVAG